MKALYKSIFHQSMAWLPVIPVTLILTGCATVGPDYLRPDTPVSSTWHTDLKGGLSAGDADPQTLAAWWATLGDPELSSLIDRAASGNLDLSRKHQENGFFPS